MTYVILAVLTANSALSVASQFHVCHLLLQHKDMLGGEPDAVFRKVIWQMQVGISKGVSIRLARSHESGHHSRPAWPPSNGTGFIPDRCRL